MRIALDGLPLSRELTGIGYYTLELGLHLANENPNDRFSAVSPRAFVPTVTSKLIPANLELLRPSINPIIRLWWKRGLSKYLRSQGVEVFHGTNYELPQNPPCATVLTIHDLSTLLHPQTHEAHNVRRAEMNLLRTAESATMIISPTEAVREEIHRELKIPREKVRAIHEAARTCFSEPGAEQLARLKQRFELSGDFVLYIGTIEPRKNLLSLVLAFEQLIDRFPNLQLVIAGRKGWKVDGLLAYIRRSPATSRIIFTGYLSDEDLCALYSSCKLFVYPSIYEGFGLPPLEAMSCGAPVIASDIPPIAEVAGDAARLVKPDNFESLKSAIEELLNDSVLRTQLANAGRRRAKQFSWTKTAEQVREIYDEAHDRHTKSKKG